MEDRQKVLELEDSHHRHWRHESRRIDNRSEAAPAVRAIRDLSFLYFIGRRSYAPVWFRKNSKHCCRSGMEEDQPIEHRILPGRLKQHKESKAIISIFENMCCNTTM